MVNGKRLRCFVIHWIYNGTFSFDFLSLISIETRWHVRSMTDRSTPRTVGWSELVQKRSSWLLVLFLGLLGSIAIPMSLLVDCRSQADDSSSMYSLATSQFSDGSSMNWKRRSFYLQHSSKNSQLSLKYLFHPRDWSKRPDSRSFFLASLIAVLV